MTAERKTKIIGLAGGVASGKSLVAEQFAARGAAVIDADRVGHEVLRDPQVRQLARQRWGESIFDPDGHVNRRALAQIVFASAPDGPRELAYLEQLTHGRIEQIVRQRIERLLEQPALAAVVLDAPLMFKAGWTAFCDKIVYVDAPREMRAARARSRGWSEEEFARREAAQQSLEEKCKHADFVIDNSGPPEALKAQVDSAWTALVG